MSQSGSSGSVGHENGAVSAVNGRGSVIPGAGYRYEGKRKHGRATAGRPWAAEVAVLVGFLVAGAAATWPRPEYIAGRLPPGGDTGSYVWSLWWMAHQVVHLGDPWFTHYMAAPAGISLAFDTLMPLIGLVMSPVTLAFGPSVSFSLLAIVTPGLAGYAMYRAARLWLPSRTAAIAAGAFFGLSGMQTWQDWYHINIAIGNVFLPLTLEAAVRLRRAPTARHGAILGVVIGASMLVNQETAILVAILATALLGPWMVFAPSLARLRGVAAAAATTVVAAAPQLAVMIPQAGTPHNTVVTHTLARQYVRFAGELPSLFAPSPRVADIGLTGLASVFHAHTYGESLATFGVVLTAVAVLGLIVGWRRRSTWGLGLLWAGSAALALGPTLYLNGREYVPLAQTWHGVRVSLVMPYTWFVRMPGLSAFREADRLAFLGLAAAALLAGAGVEWLLRHARPVLAGVVVLAALEAGWSGAAHQRTMPTTLASLDRPIAADQSSSLVVDVPYGLRGGVGLYGTRIAPMALVIATADGHPRAISYTSWVPAPTTAAIKRHRFYTGLVAAQRGRLIGPSRIAAARADLARLHVGWLLVWAPHPGRALTQYLARTGFRFDYRADGVEVYRPRQAG